MINFRQLECLRAIMMTGSMTQAAEQLGIAQPSASSLIANLEHAIGFPLFERVKGRLVPTPEARFLMPDVQRTLESAELTAHRARQIRENRHGDLTIVSYPDIAIDFLPRMVSEYLADKPAVKVKLQARRSEMMSGLLQTHDYDLAIATQLSSDTNLEVQEFRIPCGAVFPKDMAPKDTDVVTVDQLTGLPLVTAMGNHPVTVQIADRFAQSGTPFPGAEIEAQTFESVCTFALHGNYVGVVDVINARKYSERLDFRRIVPEITNSLFLFRPVDRQASKLAQGFIAKISDELSQYLDLG